MVSFHPLQVNVIHTANPVEHANHMAAQPQFVHPEHRSFVDLSGHNLASPHPFAGRTIGKYMGQNAVGSRWVPPLNLAVSPAHSHCLSANPVVSHTDKLVSKPGCCGVSS